MSRGSSNSRTSQGQRFGGSKHGSAMRMQERDQPKLPTGPSRFNYSDARNREMDDDDDMDSGSIYSASGRKIFKPVTMYKSNLDRQVTELDVNQGMPIVGCMPGCTYDHDHEYDYDYSRNYLDALNKRPGEFVEYNWMAANYYLLQEENQGVVCDGILQTPINLDTTMPITNEFKDYNFEFKYADINPRKQVKFNQKGQQVQIVLESPKSPLENFFRTSTISLFEPHIDCCNLHGLQYHFHAPSEHSVNGQLMDLEMHIVHAFEPKVKG